MVDLATTIGSLKLEHPVINASGTFDLLEAGEALLADLSGDFPFSAYVPKTVTYAPRKGNDPPRLYETAAGLLNSIGLANKGIQAFLDEDLPRLSALTVPLIASVAGERVDEYGRAAELIAGRDEIAAIELNVSCPNIDAANRALGCDPELTYKATKLAASAGGKPLIVKLTPNVTDIVALAQSAVEGGATAVSVINTVHGMALDPWTLKPALSHITGGLSGPAIKPVALRAIYLIAGQMDVPIIGMGGVTSAQDILEFLAAGASAVAIGTASFRDPLIATRLTGELRELLQQRGFLSVTDAIGVAHR
jgi:dihydroorotate dehydrogenase (NAD+) catalytic subunit